MGGSTETLLVRIACFSSGVDPSSARLLIGISVCEQPDGLAKDRAPTIGRGETSSRGPNLYRGIDHDVRRDNRRKSRSGRSLADINPRRGGDSTSSDET